MAGVPKPLLISLGAAAISLAVAASALGQVPSTQTFTTSQSEFTAGVRNQGWWSRQPTIVNSDSNANYVVSRGDGASEENFFTFDLRGLPQSCSVRAATLRLTRFEGSGTGTLTYQLWDVSTSAAVLNRNDGFSQTIAADLSSGTSFGSFAVDSASSLDKAEILSFPLNAAGITAVSAARGGFFSIGGALSTVDNGFLFGFSNNGGTQELVLDCGSTPTRTAECKTGGWRSFAIFKNQGQCISFVLHSASRSS
jgi:hypothetical protein